MSLNIKSNQNKMAFDYLNEHNLYSPSVHCGYYSCFQKIVYILKHYFEDEYNLISSEKVPGGKGNLHGMCIREFINQYKRNFDRREASELKNSLMELKSFRIEADYNDKLISDVEIGKVKNLVENFHLLVRRNFKS